MTSWIKCSERMPQKPSEESPVDYLIYYAPSSKDKRIRQATWNGEYWYEPEYGDPIATEFVTHWQPLPEPPT